jgi:hypothetical protein
MLRYNGLNSSWLEIILPHDLFQNQERRIPGNNKIREVFPARKNIFNDFYRILWLVTGITHLQYIAGISKLFMSPGIDSKEPIPPGCVAWRTRTKIPIPTRFLALIDCSKIPAQYVEWSWFPLGTLQSNIGSTMTTCPVPIFYPCVNIQYAEKFLVGA